MDDVEIMKFVAAVIADQSSRLLEMHWLEIHLCLGAIAMRLLTPRRQPLGELAATGLVAIKQQVPGPRRQAEEGVRIGCAQPLKIDGQYG